MIAVFCGGRDWTDRAMIRADLEQLPADTIVVAGGQSGADTIAAELAEELLLHVAVIRAQWRRRGRSAGPVRNAAMLRLQPDIVYAYDTGGPGTFDMRRRTLLAGVELVVRKAVPA